MERVQDTRANSLGQLEVWGYDYTKFETTYQPEEIELVASDGEHVPTYYYSIDGNLAKDTVILVCGMGGDAICMAPWTEMYLKNDMNVLAIDRRRTGKDKEGQLIYG